MLVHLGLLQERDRPASSPTTRPSCGAIACAHPRRARGAQPARSRTRCARSASAAASSAPASSRWESGQDHVALYLYNGPEWIESMYGVLKARAAFVNVNYRYKAEELRYVLENGDARAIIYHAAFAPTLAAVRDQLPMLAPPDPGARRFGEPLLPGARRLRDLGRRRRRRASRSALLRRRPLRALHRRHHGPAEGRALAPRGRLLQRARRPPARASRGSRPTSSCATT